MSPMQTLKSARLRAREFDRLGGCSLWDRSGPHPFRPPPPSCLCLPPHLDAQRCLRLGTGRGKSSGPEPPDRTPAALPFPCHRESDGACPRPQFLASRLLAHSPASREPAAGHRSASTAADRPDRQSITLRFLRWPHATALDTQGPFIF